MTGGATLALFDTLLAGLVRASWQAGVLALLVLLVSAALRGRLEPRWRFGLWLVVFARLALPVTPPAPWSVYQLVTPAPAAPTPNHPTELPVTRPAPADHPRAWAAGPTEPRGPVAEIAPGPVGRTVPDREIAPAPIPGLGQEIEPDREVVGPPQGVVARQGVAVRWLTGVWAVGVLVVFARFGCSLARLRREQRRWKDVSAPVALNVFRRCLDDLPVARPVRLLVGPDRFGPATFGVFRPVIVVPEPLLTGLTPGELRLVLLHELTHIRRWDVLVDRMAGAVAGMHWFNPIVWLALGRLRRDRELACDAAVLRQLDAADRGRYGHTLLNVAGRLVPPVRMPGAVGAFAKDQSLVRRIWMIAHYRTPGRAGTLLGGLLLLGLTAVGLTDAAVGSSPAADPVAASPGANPEPAKTIALAGVCEDEAGKPLAGVRVTLYREDRLAPKVDQLRSVETDANGRFEFRDLPPLPPAESRPDWAYAIAVTKPGRGSVIRSVYAGLEKSPLQLRLQPAGTLKGRVTDPAGKPVAGAWVWCPSSLAGPVDGVGSARTDADGRYEIRDMTAWDAAKVEPTPVGEGVFTRVSGCYLSVSHPDYGLERPLYRRIPDTIDVVLRPAGVITGRVVDRVTGKPAPGVQVCAQGTHANTVPGFHQTRTAADGTYRLPSLTAGAYNLWSDAPDRTCTALDSFAVEAGKVRPAPDLILIEGGWLEGQLVDATTGKPIDGTKERLTVALYGPSRPKSGAACQGSAVDGQGRFRLHAAPGVNYPYIMLQDYWTRTQRREFYEKGIEVKPGEVATLEFRILPTKPVPDPEPDPVRLAVPVAAERNAAAAVRRLGGWYQVDADGHVVEVNMVYHETAGRRYDNRIIDTDEALRAVGAFPRLKRLFLKSGQATDDGLRAVTRLTELEILLIWDADRVTAAGVGHLAELTKLRRVGLISGKLGDDTLAVFGRMPAIQELSLQGNEFSDDGLKHLSGLKQLRVLWVGMNRKPITDAGARHLAGLKGLEQLDLQGAKLTDAGVAALKDLTQLRDLYLCGDQGAITDASVPHLLGMTKLRHLGVQNSRLTEPAVRRLLGLTDLKQLMLATSAIPQERGEELKKLRPELKLYLTGARPRD